jgi:hypothetical protein
MPQIRELSLTDFRSRWPDYSLAQIVTEAAAIGQTLSVHTLRSLWVGRRVLNKKTAVSLYLLDVALTAKNDRLRARQYRCSNGYAATYFAGARICGVLQ